MKGLAEISIRLGPFYLVRHACKLIIEPFKYNDRNHILKQFKGQSINIMKDNHSNKRFKIKRGHNDTYTSADCNKKLQEQATNRK